ncbi:MAG: flagellar hook-associated protein FlgK, partial [candidate division Zixibacteria bacterium]
LEMGNTRANDLRDRRDLLLDQLSTLIDVNSIENKAGDVTVYIGAMSIVNGPDSMRIDTKVANINGQPVHQLVWEGTPVTITNLNGQLKGLVDSRDELIPRYMEQLDTIAAAVVEEVNSLHITGYGLDGSTGVNFFDPSCVKASNIKINIDILNNPSSIAASASGEEGDQEIALAISKLRDVAVMEDDTLSIDDFYNSLVGTLGVESKQAQSFTSNFELLLEQIEFSRQSVQGVSLDEEMTNMVKYQQSYDAAARFITAMDQALDTVIATMGIVGR